MEVNRTPVVGSLGFDQLALAAIGLTVLFAARPVAPQVQASATSFSGRRLINLSGWIVYNTYRTDTGGQFQYGTPVIQPGFAGSAGLSTNKAVFGTLEAGGVNEEIRTKDLPQPVIAAANQFTSPSLDLNRTSLRLQSGWGFGAGVYLFRDLEIGARSSQDSWRYDWLGYPAGTTIPYLKGKMWSRVGFVRYTGELKRLQAILDAGGGRAPADFSQGYESNLKDGHETLLARLPSGVTIPLSGRLGFAVIKNGGQGLNGLGTVVVFARYDYSLTNFGDTRIYKRQIACGLEFEFASK
jgi:hypothetical protein